MATERPARDRPVEPGPDRPEAIGRPAAGSLLSPVAGWLTAWGAAALAAECLVVAGVGLGLGFGIADRSASGLGGADLAASADFWPSVWLLVVQAGAFLAGGYVAARMARRLGTLHAVAAWGLAMIATGADAIVAAIRGEGQVLAGLGLPTWVHNGLDASFGTALALAIFAVGSLVTAILGGILGDAANRMDLRRVRREVAVRHEEPRVAARA